MCAKVSCRRTESLFFCILMAFATVISTRGLQEEKVVVEEDGEWRKLAYPNPLTHPSQCNRHDSSYVCDPDGVLTVADADRLDLLSNEIHQNTPCLCTSCPTERISGVSLGIFLRSNFTVYERSIKDFTAEEMTRHLRKQWQLGACHDDIIIVVIVEEKKSHFDMGDAVLQLISRELAEEIFSDCVVYFETGYYSQGLRSIVNSFHDVLRRSRRRSATESENLSLGVIVGLTVGIIALILLATAIIYRERQKRVRKGERMKTAGSRNQMENRQGIEYGLCDADDGESG